MVSVGSTRGSLREQGAIVRISVTPTKDGAQGLKYLISTKDVSFEEVGRA